ncbi:ceramidase domain-containing protein [Streptomyces sp. NPDC093544]|uniref:ceramidase domain-containing protein n=1 Tax=Streptomyces sp. NPDC093544 TaxID=3155200 RepID=UPI003449582B
MNWNEHLDEYCERGSAAFWAEPVNALTNFAFVVAALAVWRILRPYRRVPADIGLLVPFMALIGIGSFAFHTLATRWSQALDVVPITLFVLFCLACILRRFYGLPWRRCVLGVAGFVVFTAVFGVLVGGLIPNRSGMYVPVLLLMTGLAVTLRGSRDAGRAAQWRQFAAAAVVFAVALSARAVDEEICGAFPLGAHFLWHTLDGVLVFLVSRALVRHWRYLADQDRLAVPVTAVEESRAVAPDG